MDTGRFSKPLELKDIRIQDDFWKREQELVRKEVIPYQWNALNDNVPGAAPSFCMRNFKAAAKLMREKKENAKFIEPRYTYRGFNILPEKGKEPEDNKFYGFVFQDSDFSKWIEAVGYCLATNPDSELEKTADEAIDIVCAAQAENGYLDTYYIIGGMDRIFTNLRDHHELYCFGHLLEGAIAYYQATGKDKLLQAAKRYADFIASKFGPEEGKIHGYPGHEIAEMALCRLYELTSEKRYLELAKYFIDERGKQPYIFDEQEKERAQYTGEDYTPNNDPKRYRYHQAHIPVREQNEAVGHAVRAVYLYSGMADVARLTGDDELFKACERIWNNIVEKKLYVTGGIGGTHLGEAFSHNYDLPNDLAYSESCAAIGLAFFARRMLEIEPKGTYGDVMEMALYNTVLAGMALDGKSFFYVNPLEVDPEDCIQDERKHHVKPVRQKWFGCACCPPNIARTVASLGNYAYTVSEDCLYTHLYVGSSFTATLGGREIAFKMESGFPWNGSATMHVSTNENNAAETAALASLTEETKKAGNIENTSKTEDMGTTVTRFSLSFRIPGWCGGKYRLLIDGKELSAPGTDSISISEKDGYLFLTSDWSGETEIRLEFETKIRVLSSNPLVKENTGKVAFTRGPVTYCMEAADNGSDLWEIAVLPDELDSSKTTQGEIEGVPVMFIDTPAVRIHSKSTSALYADYSAAETEKITARLVPYFAWANRGEGQMRVWIPANNA